MGRYKVKKYGKRIDIILYEQSAARITWLKRESTSKLSTSYIINEAIMAYKIDEIDTKRQKIKELVKEHNRLRNEINERQEELAGMIAGKEAEPMNELKAAFQAKREAST